MENDNETIPAEKGKFLKTINAAGCKMTNFFDTAITNLDKIIAVPVIAGAVWGSGVGFGATAQIIHTADKYKQTAYEKSVDEITEKRSKLVMAGADSNVLNEFDAQNPQPERPEVRGKVTAGDYARSSVLGGLVGAIGGGILPLAATAGTMLIGGTGFALRSAANTDERKEEEEEIESLR